jgi:hypothetical protein
VFGHEAVSKLGRPSASLTIRAIAAAFVGIPSGPGARATTVIDAPPSFAFGARRVLSSTPFLAEGLR